MESSTPRARKRLEFPRVLQGMFFSFASIFQTNADVFIAIYLSNSMNKKGSAAEEDEGAINEGKKDASARQVFCLARFAHAVDRLFPETVRRL
jgi:hypothetical protein